LWKLSFITCLYISIQAGFFIYSIQDSSCLMQLLTGFTLVLKDEDEEEDDEEDEE
jgi:hypothetical protein